VVAKTEAPRSGDPPASASRPAEGGLAAEGEAVRRARRNRFVDRTGVPGPCRLTERALPLALVSWELVSWELVSWGLFSWELGGSSAARSSRVPTAGTSEREPGTEGRCTISAVSSSEGPAGSSVCSETAVFSALSGPAKRPAPKGSSVVCGCSRAGIARPRSGAPTFSGVVLVKLVTSAFPFPAMSTNDDASRTASRAAQAGRACHCGRRSVIRSQTAQPLEKSAQSTLESP